MIRTGFEPDFNSSMVRLRDWFRSSCWRLFLISIPVWYDWELDAEGNNVFVIKFQFQYGTIERLHEVVAHKGLRYFNSSMVRLRARHWVLSRRELLISIPVWYDWEEITELREKQIRDISIPVWYDWETKSAKESLLNDKFQFQYGTIERLQWQ